jgi:hypothetical protein
VRDRNAIENRDHSHVLSRKGELIVWNPIFGQVALDYRFAPELCWPRAGNQKGTVENLVGWVKGSFFTCRRFHDRADLEAQLAEWLRAVNTERPSRATGVIPVVRLEQDERPRPRAQALAAAAEARQMPPDTLGQAATLHLYRHRIAIVTKAGLVVHHPRLEAPRASSILPEHRAAMLGAVRGGRAKLYYQRQSLWELGPAAERWLTELVHRWPNGWRPDVEDCFQLLQDYGPPTLVAAFAWGVRHHAIGAEYVRTHLARRPAVQEAAR